MKQAIFAASLLLVACAKDERQYTYGVSCESCSVGYHDETGEHRYVRLAPDTAFIFNSVDTVIAGVDTTVIVSDTITSAIPVSWETTFTAPLDHRPKFSTSKLCGNCLEVHAYQIIDGKREDRYTGDGVFYLEFD